ncbi:glycosyltransferase family 4 protein [Deferribacter autotrophicus]|uniref:Glycosyltransferase family 4 protein n=1 Tax=Deferribacter autotrophicus TaxID=500465 RepID=A0A5A8F8T5_9BACT|nr:glycosyltransferase family 4 protein [Deferribacter autotrophicus]KAA0258992.1 glycosyltransferase family 4 protein [Deferribacter autotrophicus]
MKILHIDTGKEWRGGQRQVFILHKNLLKNNIDSFLVCNENGILYSKAKDELQNVISLPGNIFQGIFNLKKILRKINPDILHFHDGKSLNFIEFMPASMKKIETRRVSYPISFFSRKVKYSLCDYHVAVSEEIAEYLRQFFKNVFVINSCIEIDRFVLKKPKNPFKKRFNKNILFVGSFSKQKGIEVLLEAFKSVVEQIGDVGLHLVGGGSLEKDLWKMVDDLGIVDNVLFYGFQKEVEQFYFFADLVVVPSVDGEGSSGVIKEALASGKTVIASNLDANKEIIKDNYNGILFENKNKSDLSNKIKLVLNHKIVLDKNKILETAKQFSCEKMTYKYIKIYDEILNKDGRL